MKLGRRFLFECAAFRAARAMICLCCALIGSHLISFGRCKESALCHVRNPLVGQAGVVRASHTVITAALMSFKIARSHTAIAIEFVTKRSEREYRNVCALITRTVAHSK